MSKHLIVYRETVWKVSEVEAEFLESVFDSFWNEEDDFMGFVDGGHPLRVIETVDGIDVERQFLKHIADSEEESNA